jgi:hypothetical protein
MTTPVATGYPDWGRRSPSADALYVQAIGQVIGAPYVYGPLYVGDVPHLGLYMRGVGNDLTVSFQWWADPALTIYLGQYEVTVAAGGESAVAVPVRGPYLAVQLSAVAYPATADISVWSLKSNSNDLRLGATSNILMSVTGPLVNAGVTRVDNVTDARPGPACLSAVWVEGGVGTCTLYANPPGGALQVVAAIDMTVTSGISPVYLPCVPLQIRTANTDAVNKHLWMALTTPPLYIA